MPRCAACSCAKRARSTTSARSCSGSIGAGAGQQPAHPADGRAVRCARSAHPRRAAAGVRGSGAPPGEDVGVRDVIGKEGLEQVFEVLRAPFTEEPTNWSRRYKANLEKLASGDVIKVSEVVRDLWRRDQDRGLSAGEKRMLAKARQILVSELALARKTDEEKASAELDTVLAS